MNGSSQQIKRLPSNQPDAKSDTHYLPRHLYLERAEVALQDAWRQQNRLLVEDVLHLVADICITPDELWRLIRLEMDFRIQHGEIISISEYANRFPECQSRLESDYPPLSQPLANHGTNILPAMLPVPEMHDTPAVVQVPGYDIVDIVGRGGMGVVYKAVQHGLNRTVALKMILSGRHASQEDLARFWVEAEAIASLNHPNIVQVYEINRIDGTPYITLEFIEGGTLEKLLRQGPLTAREAATMLETIARAMHHAHTKQILHRDLKPANILLDISQRMNAATNPLLPRQPKKSGISRVPTERDHAPLIPKITDFGVAKRLDMADGLTATGNTTGTPKYMSPEQAVSHPKNPLTPATDIYSLGVILYECLTGKVPIDGNNAVDIMRRLLREPPIPPTRLKPSVPYELEIICLKCLEKEPSKRYRTANELANDLRRWLDGEPISARAISRMEYSYRWVARNRLVAALLASIMLVMVIGTTAATILAFRSERYAIEANANSIQLEYQIITTKEYASKALAAKQEADDAKELLRQQLETVQQARETERLMTERLKSQLYGFKISSAYQEYNVGQFSAMIQLVTSLIPQPHEKDNRGFEWWYLQQLGHPAMHDDQKIHQLSSLQAEDKFYGWVGCTHEELIWFGSRGAINKRLKLPKGEIQALQLNRTANRLLLATGESAVLNVYDLEAFKLIREIPLATIIGDQRTWKPRQISIAGDGKTAALTMIDTANKVFNYLIILDLETGQLVSKLEQKHAWLQGIAHATKSNQLVGVTLTGEWFVWEERSLRELSTGKRPGIIAALAVQQDGRLFAISNHDGTIEVINPSTGDVDSIMTGQTGRVSPIVISPDGQLLASSCIDCSIRVYEMQTGALVQKLPGHESKLSSIAFSRDNEFIFSGSERHGFSIWKHRRDSEANRIHRSKLKDASYLLPMPDQQQWLSTDRLGGIQYLKRDGNPASPYQQLFPTTAMTSIWALAPDGKSVVVRTEFASTVDQTPTKNPNVRGALWHVPLKPEDSRKIRLPDSVADAKQITISPDSKLLATLNDNGTICIVDLTTYQQVHSMTAAGRGPNFIAFAADSRSIYLGISEQMQLRRLALNGEPLWEFQLPESVGRQITAMAISHTRNQVALATANHDIWLIDSRSGLSCTEIVPGSKQCQPIMLRGHQQPVLRMTFNPRGDRLASVSEDGVVRIWETEYWQQLLILRAKPSQQQELAFSADGASLAHAGEVQASLWNGHHAYRDFMLGQIEQHGRFDSVTVNMDTPNTLKLTGLFVNQSSTNLIYPRFELNRTSLTFVVQFKIPETTQPIPNLMRMYPGIMMSRQLYELTFDELSPNEAAPIGVTLDTTNWPPGTYQVRFLHSGQKTDNRKASAWREFRISPPTK